VRTTADASIPPQEALKLLKEGNTRFLNGAPTAAQTDKIMRKELVDMGQAPHTAIIGCADSRAPLETIFDAMPGDLFVLRNAGNTCTHAEGSMVGSLEFCCGKLGSKLILVMGHTKCGAIAGATATYLANKGAEGKAMKSAGSALEGLLVGLSGVAKQAEEELGPGADQDELVSLSVRVNVFSSIDFLLKYSPSLKELVKNGNLEMQGGIYHLETGRVEFLGRSPRQAELLRSDTASVPPSLQALPIRTTTDGPLPSKEALKLLKDGNARFTSGAAISGKITPGMRKALVNEGQAPHTAIIGCADSRAPLETVFDAMPGDIFVLRNAGNTCTHAEGSMVGSLEFCLGALKTKMVLVLGHTACGAIKGATSTYLQSKTGNAPQVGDIQSMFEAVDFIDMMSIMWGGVYNLFIYSVGSCQIW
jgi:carbonic anhydrase